MEKINNKKVMFLGALLLSGCTFIKESSNEKVKSIHQLGIDSKNVRCITEEELKNFYSFMNNLGTNEVNETNITMKNIEKDKRFILSECSE